MTKSQKAASLKSKAKMLLRVMALVYKESYEKPKEKALTFSLLFPNTKDKIVQIFLFEHLLICILTPFGQDFFIV